MQNQLSIDALNKNVKYSILSFLDRRSLIHMQCASKHWKKVIDDSLLMYILNNKLIFDRYPTDTTNKSLKKVYDILNAIENNFLLLLQNVNNDLAKIKRLIEFIEEIEKYLSPFTPENHVEYKSIEYFHYKNKRPDISCKKTISKQIEMKLIDAIKCGVNTQGVSFILRVDKICKITSNHIKIELKKIKKVSPSHPEYLSDTDAFILNTLSEENKKSAPVYYSFFNNIARNHYLQVFGRGSLICGISWVIVGLLIKTVSWNEPKANDMVKALLITGTLSTTLGTPFLAINQWARKYRASQLKSTQDEYAQLFKKELEDQLDGPSFK